MDLWLQKVGKMKAPEALQRDVLKIMERKIVQEL